MLKKIWHDPVGSKVISQWIIAGTAFVVGVVIFWLLRFWPNIGSLPQQVITLALSRSQILNWLLAIACLVFLCSIFLCFALIFRYKRAKTNVSNVKLDILVYKKIKKILPWDGSIDFIREHDFRGRFYRVHINDLYKYYDECRDPDFYFMDPLLERRRKALFKKIDQFLELVTYKTCPVEDNSDRYEIPWEWKKDRPKDFKQVPEKLNKFSRQIWECYDSVVKIGRKKLNVDDSPPAEAIAL